MLALHSRIVLIPSRRPQPQRAVIFIPWLRACSRVSIIYGKCRRNSWSSAGLLPVSAATLSTQAQYMRSWERLRGSLAFLPIE
jgi:hypothetical protein